MRARVDRQKALSEVIRCARSCLWHEHMYFTHRKLLSWLEMPNMSNIFCHRGGFVPHTFAARLRSSSTVLRQCAKQPQYLHSGVTHWSNAHLRSSLSLGTPAVEKSQDHMCRVSSQKPMKCMLERNKHAVHASKCMCVCI